MMISKDAVRYLRSVSGRRYRQYVCPFCTSRAISSASAKSQGHSPSRSYASVSSPRPKPLLETTPAPGADLADLAIGNGNIREYLKKWSQERQEQEEKLGNLVIHNRKPWVPDSLYIRNVHSLDEATDAATDAVQEFGLETEDPFDLSYIVTDTVAYTMPGDVFTVKAPEIQPQLGLHLGYVGRQSQMLLQHGSWFQGMTRRTKGVQILHNFASAKEIAKVKELLPKSLIKQGESANHTGMTATGPVPAHIFKPFQERFRRIQDEADEFRREYSGKFDHFYEQLAHETDYKRINLHEAAQDYLVFDYPRAPGGARIAFVEKLLNDPRFLLRRSQNEEVENALLVLPRRVVDGTRLVASWARDYQDAAARASAGKDVLPDLMANPLTKFIAKARKLIAKSRTIRTYDEWAWPNATFPDARPSHQLVERKPTGEGFSDQDKIILTVIWDTYMRRPVSSLAQSKLPSAIIALILRAVGAYPNRQLDLATAFLFLKELGCKEPWSSWNQDQIFAPMPFLGLSHNLKLVDQRELKGLKDLNLDGVLDQSKLVDTMADVRTDWKDMKAIAVDPFSTRVVDDAFSIVPSAESLDLTWIHMHIAHPAAFIPPHHDLLARPEAMDRGYYPPSGGSVPYLPRNLLDIMSISDKRDTPVMTVSTLLHADGTIRDVQVAAATLRNVSRIDTHSFSTFHNQRTVFDRTLDRSLNRFKLKVGGPFRRSSTDPNDVNSHQQEMEDFKKSSTALCQEYASELRLMNSLLRARFEARKRENPNHLRLPKQDFASLDIEIDGYGEPDLSFDRILRSEHCYGDPHVRIFMSTSKSTEQTTFADYPENLGIMVQLKLLATESLGLFTRKHKIPVIYNVVEPMPEFPVEVLNRATRYERLAWPITGKSLQPARHIFANVQQQVSATSPLRSFTDLINQYQINTFLKSQGRQDTESKPVPSYPYSKADLKRIMDEVTSGDMQKLVSTYNKHWTFYALYKSWQHDENFPKTLDARIPTILADSVTGRNPNIVSGTLTPWPVKVLFEPTEQGYELSAKPSQFVPIKITSIDALEMIVHATAIGVASDAPNFPRNFMDSHENFIEESAAPSTDK